MYRIVFFDIDGTLLTSAHVIPESTSRSIEELRSKDIVSVIASGRTPFNIKHVLEATGIESYILYNGALVIAEGEVLHRALFEEENVLALKKMALENKHSVILDEERNFSIHSANALWIRQTYLPGWDLHYESSTCDTTGVFQIELFCQNEEVMNYERAFPTLTFYPWMSKKNAFNVVPINISKVNGIQALLKFFHIDKSETIAFGDGENDLEMISFVGRGIAMGNASHRLKAHADFVTHHVDDHGIRIALKQLQVI